MVARMPAGIFWGADMHIKVRNAWRSLRRSRRRWECCSCVWGVDCLCLHGMKLAGESHLSVVSCWSKSVCTLQTTSSTVLLISTISSVFCIWLSNCEGFAEKARYQACASRLFSVLRVPVLPSYSLDFALAHVCQATCHSRCRLCLFWQLDCVYLNRHLHSCQLVSVHIRPIMHVLVILPLYFVRLVTDVVLIIDSFFGDAP